MRISDFTKLSQYSKTANNESIINPINADQSLQEVA